MAITRLISRIMLLLLLSGCAIGQRKMLDVGFEDVQANGKLKHIENGEFQDEYVKVKAAYVDREPRFSQGSDGGAIIIHVENKSKARLRLVWNDVAFVDPDGRTVKAFHGNVSLYKRHEEQIFSAIPPGAVFEDVVYSSENVSWIGDRWRDTGLLGHYRPPTVDYSISKNEKLRDEFFQKLLGKTMRLELSFDREGKRLEYSLTFKVNGYGRAKLNDGRWEIAR